MSHFVVGVIHPKDVECLDAFVKNALQPYHQFECTGTDDVYVQDIDITKECEERYKEYSCTKYKCPKTGETLSGYDARFYRPMTDEEKKELGEQTGGWGFSGKYEYDSREWEPGKYEKRVKDVSEYEKVTWRAEENISFLQYCISHEEKPVVASVEDLDLANHKFGYILLEKDGTFKVINRTNPHYKWDWWVIGGRWKDLIEPGTDTADLVKFDATNKNWYPFAIVVDGEWIERGSMGWWGMVADEKDEESWKQSVQTIFEKYKDKAITFVDCHI